MNDTAGFYCDKGKRISELQQSRTGTHKTLSKLNTTMAQHETKLDYIAKGIDEIKGNLSFKVDWRVFMLILGIIGALGYVIWSEVSGIRSYLSQYDIEIRN